MKKMTLRKKLVMLFILTSTVPIILLAVYDLYNVNSVLDRNTEFFVRENLDRVDANLNIRLDSYDDLLYQIYTNDDVVKWVDALNAGEDEAVVVSQLRRYLRGLFYTKDFIKSITVITENGDVVVYDQLTSATYENSWLPNFSMTPEEIYDRVSNNNKTVILDTEYGTTFANEDYYLFHMAHRVVDYKKPYRRMGIVILTLDENFMQEILQTNEDENSPAFNFLVGRNGQVISCPDQALIGQIISSAPSPDSAEQQESSGQQDDSTNSINASMLRDCKAFAAQYGGSKSYTDLFIYEDVDLGWTIAEPIDQSDIAKEMNRKELMIAGLGILVLVATIIALYDVLRKEKEANDEQRRAEIKALEAQINPHFLYNTLDTINWMAIDKDEFDISNAINSLATILRYAISKSDEIVTVWDETEWLKKYIYLQQYRLKNKFVCKMEVSPEVTDLRIHKLLLQPFVENAIIHGFSGVQEQYILLVEFALVDEQLVIVIEDNGCGIDEDTLKRLQKGEDISDPSKNHLGVKNALTRLHMYYEGHEKVQITGQIGHGTRIEIRIPAQKG